MHSARDLHTSCLHMNEPFHVVCVISSVSPQPSVFAPGNINTSIQGRPACLTWTLPNHTCGSTPDGKHPSNDPDCITARIEPGKSFLTSTSA